MRKGNHAELQVALGKARWPAPRRMITKRSIDLVYSDRGTEVATVHKSLSRGKVVSESIMINPKYLGEGDEKR